METELIQKQHKDYHQALELQYKLGSAEFKELANKCLNVGGELPSHFKCGICLGLLFEPQECSKCQNPFCKICLTEWMTQDSRCPTCKGQDLFPPLHRVLRQQLSELQVQCQQCSAQLAYEQLEKHASLCIQKETACPLNCGQIITSKESGLTHFQECVNLLVQCEKCSATFPRAEEEQHPSVCLEEEEACAGCRLSFKKKDGAKHLLECPERSEACKKCGVVVKLREKEAHDDTCAEAELKCTKCQQTYLRKDLSAHDCISQIMSQLMLVNEKITAQSLQLDRQANQIDELQHQHAFQEAQLKQKDFQISKLQTQMAFVQSNICGQNQNGNYHHWDFGKSSGRRCKNCGKDEEFNNEKRVKWDPDIDNIIEF